MKTKQLCLTILLSLIVIVSCKKEKIKNKEEEIFGNYNIIAYIKGNEDKTALYPSECACEFEFFSTIFQDYHDLMLKCPQPADSNHVYMIVGLWKMKDENTISLTLGFDSIPGVTDNLCVFPFNIYNVEQAIEDNNIKFNDYTISKIDDNDIWIERTITSIKYELKLKKK